MCHVLSHPTLFMLLVLSSYSTQSYLKVLQVKGFSKAFQLTFNPMRRPGLNGYPQSMDEEIIP